MAFIEFKNIGKKYVGAEKKSVDDFNLEINEKEFIAFVGPSGCGKSTTLRMIAGFEEITEGELYIDGKKVNEVAPRDRGIAMVFQNYALYPHMTVEKNIGYGLKNMKMPADQIKEKVDWAIDILGLQEYRNRKPKNLSGGRTHYLQGGTVIRWTASASSAWKSNRKKSESISYGRTIVKSGCKTSCQYENGNQ